MSDQRVQIGVRGRGKVYGDLKINNLVSESRHRIIEAEAVLANISGGEDEVALSFLLAFHDHALFAWGRGGAYY